METAKLAVAINFSVILFVQGLAAELVGPVPTELQFYNSFVAGADAKQAEIAKELIEFVTAPAAIAVLKANGMEPGAP
jgi:ABC-type molybdate transport system substrate-binding protein